MKKTTQPKKTKNVQKIEKIFNIIWILAFTLAVYTIFVGFMNAFSIQHYDAGVWTHTSYESIFEIMFVDRASVFKNQVALIVAFTLLIFAIAIFVILTVLNSKKIKVAHLNFILTICAMVLLVVSSVVMFCTPVIICGPDLLTPYYKVTFGSGIATWGATSIVSAGLLGSLIFINRKFLNKKY